MFWKKKQNDKEELPINPKDNGSSQTGSIKICEKSYPQSGLPEGLSMKEMKEVLDHGEGVGVYGKSTCIFEKVDINTFINDFRDQISGLNYDAIMTIYDSIKLPKRGTIGSAGYDFFAPFGFELTSSQSIVIPTGIRAYIKPDHFMAVLPRSGQGFKYRIQLANTIGIIDADYILADNNGHIMIKLVYQGFSNENRNANISIITGRTEDSVEEITYEAKLKNKEKEGPIKIEQGQAFAQGILLRYDLSEEEMFSVSLKQRKGGFGSTDNK